GRVAREQRVVGRDVATDLDDAVTEPVGTQVAVEGDRGVVQGDRAARHVEAATEGAAARAVVTALAGYAGGAGAPRGAGHPTGSRAGRPVAARAARARKPAVGRGDPTGRSTEAAATAISTLD